MRPLRDACVCLLVFPSVAAGVAACANGTPNNDGPHGEVFDAAGNAYDGNTPLGAGGGGGGDVDAHGPDDASGENPVDAGGDASPGVDAGVDSGDDAPVDAPEEVAADAGFDASPLAPSCDGVVQPGEYGANDQVSGTQTWYMTWDDTYLYLAITTANVNEANVVYLATEASADAGATGLTAGNPYDNTLIASLPFAADLVVYAKASYNEARVLSAGADASRVWGAADTSVVRVCTGGGGNTREEVVPWSLVGGRPASFQWIGYLAANPASNTTGYIYGQVPVDDPGGANAGNETYTKLFAIPDATPGAYPFHEQ
jgi:hypothetical protein